MSLKIKLALLVLPILLGTSLYFNYQQKREKETYKKLLDDQYKQRYAELQQKLKQTQQQRLVLIDSVSRLNHNNQTLHELSKKQDEELKKIKGRYNNHTPSELELEMERRAK